MVPSRLPRACGSVHAGSAARDKKQQRHPSLSRSPDTAHAKNGAEARIRMLQRLSITVLALAVIVLQTSAAALAQQPGGTLRMYIWDNPPSASIHEEATVSTVTPFMSLFNNLVLFDQHEKLNNSDNIRPELATSWAWNGEKTRLTFKLREGVKWHDGAPFTAKDVACTLEKLQDRAADKFRKNPRAVWWHNLKQVVVNGDHEVTFVLGRPQPSFLSFFATGYTPMYPCHVSAAQMRTRPVGTGPFKFVEFKSNESVKIVRNQDYWRPGHPYLDGIDWRIISNRSTRALAFVAGEFDMTFSLDLTVALMKDVQSQLPNAICELQPTNNSFNLIVNREVAPFNNPQIRSALALTLDRKDFIDIITDGKGKIGGVMLAGPEGLWGMPPDIVAALPARAAAPAATAEQIAEAEEIAEDVAEVGECIGIELRTAGRALHAGMPKAIVSRALLRIAQHAISLAGFFEPLLRGRIIRIAVGVVPLRHFPVSGLDFLIAGLTPDA